MLTVGHSTHSIERFLELLTAAGVEAIADVRRHPGSRRHPHFGADALAKSLERASIGYEPFGEELGGRRRTPARRDVEPAAPPLPDNSAWRNASFRACADYLNTPAFAEGLERLQNLASLRVTTIMCAEAQPINCHRRLISDVLVTRGWSVVHLLADGRLSAHALSDHAEVENGRVFYPGHPRLDL